MPPVLSAEQVKKLKEEMEKNRGEKELADIDRQIVEVKKKIDKLFNISVKEGEEAEKARRDLDLRKVRMEAMSAEEMGLLEELQDELTVLKKKKEDLISGILSRTGKETFIDKNDREVTTIIDEAAIKKEEELKKEIKEKGKK